MVRIEASHCIVLVALGISAIAAVGPLPNTPAGYSSEASSSTGHWVMDTNAGTSAAASPGFRLFGQNIVPGSASATTTVAEVPAIPELWIDRAAVHGVYLGSKRLPYVQEDVTRHYADRIWQARTFQLFDWYFTQESRNAVIAWSRNVLSDPNARFYIHVPNADVSPPWVYFARPIPKQTFAELFPHVQLNLQEYHPVIVYRTRTQHRHSTASSRVEVAGIDFVHSNDPIWAPHEMVPTVELNSIYRYAEHGRW